VKERYRRAYDGDRRRAVGLRQRSISGMQRLRQSPIRNGLIGLAIAGTAAPIAVNHYQQALRTDATHEVITTTALGGGATDASVANMWRSMESERSGTPAPAAVAKAAAEAAPAVNARDSAIQQNIDRYSDFGLTRELAETIYDNALEAEVEPDLAFGLVQAESSFENAATSHVGAVGLTQLMPKTADWLEPGITRSDLRDANTNTRIGLKYLRQLLDKYDGNERLALLAYNRGPGTVDKVLKSGGNPDNGYVEMVNKRISR
jgi:soluble lytic murein transglycosylase-like protein